MTRPYLNELSFSAPDVNTALINLAKLRKGIASLLSKNLIELPVMCNHGVSQLPLTPASETLASMIRHQGGRFRDTIYFFLSVLDQSSPVYTGSSERTELAVNNHIIIGYEDVDIGATMALVNCCSEDGVLLSLQSECRWACELVKFSVLLDDIEDQKEMSCSNVSDEITASHVAIKLIEKQSELVLENWNVITGNAQKSNQVEEWLKETKRYPGLTQLVLRTLKLAMNANYRPDGDLIKKLNKPSQVAIFEIRAYYNGSNNVRILFTRYSDGVVTHQFGGLKTDGNFYDTAITQVESQLRP